MDKRDIIDFFDRLAPGWDGALIRSDSVIDAILEGADIRAGMSVLDVACGTGVLFEDYLRRGVTDLTAIDIAPEMVRIAREKFPQVTVLCADVERYPFRRKFQRIVVYNAFPHFPQPEALIRTLSGLLEPGGTLTVAHGMSRAAIDHHHEGAASKVSMGLIHEDALADLFAKYLTVTVKISDARMYQVTGRLTAQTTEQ